MEELSLSLDLYPYDEVAHALLDEPLGTLERTVQRKTDLENPVKLGSIYHLSSLRTMVKLASTGPVKRSDQNMAPVYKSGVATARRQAKHPRTGIVRNKARHKIHVGHAKSGARTHVDSDRRSAVGDKRARSGVVDLQADSLTSDRLREVSCTFHTVPSVLVVCCSNIQSENLNGVPKLPMSTQRKLCGVVLGQNGSANLFVQCSNYTF